MTTRTVFELFCDEVACTSMVSGPTQQIVLDNAFGAGGWRLVPLSKGHGRTEVIHRCGRHAVEPAL